MLWGRRHRFLTPITKGIAVTLAQRFFCGVLLFAIAQISTITANAQEADSQAAWNALFDRTAEAYQLFRDEQQTQPLVLHPESVYKWKAGHTGAHGSVYVWTYCGCAEAVICFWRSRSGLVHEGHSLSTAALNPVRAGSRPWHPTAGVPRQLLPGASPPSEKLSTRLAQMRRFGDAFTAHTEAKNGERRELRLLSAPVYRYESSDPEVIDGALFALVCTVGTDPEAFLMLEARKTDAGPRWHFAFARFSHLNLFAS